MLPAPTHWLQMAGPVPAAITTLAVLVATESSAAAATPTVLLGKAKAAGAPSWRSGLAGRSRFAGRRRPVRPRHRGGASRLRRPVLAWRCRSGPSVAHATTGSEPFHAGIRQDTFRACPRYRRRTR